MRKILLSSKGFIILLTLNGNSQRVSAVCSADEEEGLEASLAE